MKDLLNRKDNSPKGAPDSEYGIKLPVRNRKRVFKGILLSGFILTMSTSCDVAGALLQQVFKTPTVSIKSFSLGNYNLEKFTFNLALDVDNPNGVGIKTSNLDYNLDLNSVNIIKGVLNNGIDISAKKVSTVEVPIEINFQKVIQALPSILTDINNLNYNVYGTVNFNTPIGIVPINWKKEDKLNVPKLFGQ
jgi:LEA14-like dessication related protein